jgi:hypothetical protein
MRYAIILALAILLTPVHAAELTVVGAWTLNKDLTPMPDGNRRPSDGARGGQGRGGGGGRGGFGGRGGPGGSGGPSEEEMHRMQAIRDRLTEIPERLIITRTATTVNITDGTGRTWNLNTDGKKQERLTGEGEFSSKTHFEGAKLVVEDDFKGPKVITTFEPTLDGGEISRLIVTVKVENMQRGGRGGGGGRGGPPPGGRGGPEGPQSRGPTGVKRLYQAQPR